MKCSKRFLLTVIIYVRVYSKERLNSYSLETQEKACIDYAQRSGYRILKVFREGNVSARTFNRPQFQEMLEYIRANKWKIKFLVVADISRLSGDSVGMQRLRRFLKENGIRVISITEIMLRYSGKGAKTHH